MEALSARDRSLDLRAVQVRPTHGVQEHWRWDRLVATHHYLGFRGLFVHALRHVAPRGSTWVTLIGW